MGGGTAKIRDAVMALESTAPTGTRVRAEKRDLGFVPLLHMAGRWTPSPGWAVAKELDGLAGGPGRAFDLAITAGRDLGRGWTLHAGYRTVEGGADIEEVCSFARFHQGILGLRWTPGPE